METKKIRIAILLGGASDEKEISLESGRNVFYKLSLHKYQPIPLFVSNNLELHTLTQSQLVRNSTSEIVDLLQESQKIKWSDLPDMFDFVFNALHGGAGENGSVQGALEMLGLPYNGSSVLASALCMNKYKTNQLLAINGFDVPKHIYVTKDEWTSFFNFNARPEQFHPTLRYSSHGDPNEVNEIGDKWYPRALEEILQQVQDERSRVMDLCLLLSLSKHADDGEKQKNNVSDITYPLIVKPHDDGCSVMVQKVTNEEELIIAIEKVLQKKDAVLIEECITGMELTVGIIGNNKVQALPPSQAVSTSGILSIEEKFLPGAGENQTPAPLPQEALQFVQNIAEKVYNALQCKGYARIDCFYQNAQQSPTNKERVIILEINTLPGLTPATCLFHQAAEIGLTPIEFIDMVIKLGFEEHLPEKAKEMILDQGNKSDVTMIKNL